ncbi:MarR family winged helix-turn-helix transcriptional regulator [Gordonia rhizosphera]|uniref:Putative MarR family transcriptional regulator n=1 Tax=Gordonia rhizosphera NBRC 16068 TaxID=1108045 RepID=K6W9K1_9ACTN|nr:MarR family transcriptional regulator [Gordonia rhizosphera]GAB88882.1 putative MarR family transcriptional regulator [Gordonia rhizosphera NBRC 16068]
MPEPTPSLGDPTDVTVGSVEATCGTLLDFLDRLACLGKTHTMDTLAASELTFSQLRVMFALGAHGNGAECMSVNEIAEHVNLSLAATGRTVDKLVVAGLADRREDTADRRVKRVSLTDEGRRMVDSHLSIKQEIVRAFVAGLPDNLRADLCSALNPIIDADVDYFVGVIDPTPTSSRPDIEQKVDS